MAVFHLILSCDYDREVNKKKKKNSVKTTDSVHQFQWVIFSAAEILVCFQSRWHTFLFQLRPTLILFSCREPSAMNKESQGL